MIGKSILIFNIIFALIYFAAITFLFAPGNKILYFLLIAGEVFHLWQIFVYIYTIWERKRSVRFDSAFFPPVDVFITVAGEPEDIIAKTLEAAQAMDYPAFTVHVLNDGFVVGNPDWKMVERVAKRYKAKCITRRIPGGAKAGNINHALLNTKNPFVAIFDVDHVPHKNFLKKTVGYFTDSRVAFVQSPQYYRNRSSSYVAAAAWDQQSLFFGPICKGKNELNSAFMCGTNMLIRRDALNDVGGMCESNIAEDFVTSLFLHSKGWTSVYVPEILAEGLAPEDFFSYCKQQFRWARGSLELIVRPSYNPLFRRGLTFAQRMQYLSSASYYFSGLVVVMNAIMPLIFFYFGFVPFESPTMVLAAVFLPYIFTTVYMLQRSSNFSYTFRALSFSMGSCFVFIQAFFSALFRRKARFMVTSKKRISGNFVELAMPHIIYGGLVLTGIAFAIYREGLSASVVDNVAWAFFNLAVFVPFVLASVSESSARMVHALKRESAFEVELATQRTIV